MKTTWLAVVAVSAALLVAQVTVWGHHAFSAEFDATKPLTLSGTVSQVRWTNPHAHILVDVKDQDGKVSSWDFELGSPNGLMRRGWSRNTLKAGDAITLNGYPAKDGSRLPMPDRRR